MRKTIIIIGVLSFYLSANAYDKGYDWEKIWGVAEHRGDTIIDTVKKMNITFIYKIVLKNIDENDKIGYTPRLEKDTVFFNICDGGSACAYYYKFKLVKDTIKLIRECDPSTLMQHLDSYCVYCKIYGIKKGVYYLYYGGGLYFIKSDYIKKLVFK